MFDVPDDPLVIARARKGDLAAMETLYRTYEEPVYTLGRRLLRRPEEAEEVLQETFLEVLKSLRGFRGDGPLGFWIRKIAVNKALMRIRARGHGADDTEPAGATLSEEQAGQPSLKAGALLERLHLEAAFTRLSEVARAVVWLHDVEGFTHDEIAQMMKKTPSFSKSQLARAHARLRDYLTGDHEEAPCIQAMKTS